MSEKKIGRGGVSIEIPKIAQQKNSSRFPALLTRKCGEKKKKVGGTAKLIPLGGAEGKKGTWRKEGEKEGNLSERN